MPKKNTKTKTKEINPGVTDLFFIGPNGNSAIRSGNMSIPSMTGKDIPCWIFEDGLYVYRDKIHSKNVTFTSNGSSYDNSGIVVCVPSVYFTSNRLTQVIFPKKPGGGTMVDFTTICYIGFLPHGNNPDQRAKLLESNSDIDLHWALTNNYGQYADGNNILREYSFNSIPSNYISTLEINSLGEGWYFFIDYRLSRMPEWATDNDILTLMMNCFQGGLSVSEIVRVSI